MAVCEKCGAIGVKHSFYTKERRFCSQACAKSFNENPQANSVTLGNDYYSIPFLLLFFILIMYIYREAIQFAMRASARAAAG